MSNPFIPPGLLVHASGKVDAGGGIIIDGSDASIVVGGVGDFTIVLATEIDPTHRHVSLVMAGAIGFVTHRIVADTDSSFQVLVFNAAGAPADLDFNFAVLRVSII